MREDTQASIYQQKNTLQELYGKLIMIESVMNSRPILSISKSQEVMMLTPKQMMSPFLTSIQVETWVTQNILGLTGAPELLPVLKKNQQAKNSQLQESLLLFLQAQGIRYRAREGDGNTKDTHHLQPLIDDLVLTLVNRQRHLAKVIALSTGLENVVKIRTMYYGTSQELDRHIRTLVLVFRHSEWSGGIPVDPNDLPLLQEHDTPTPENAEEVPDLSLLQEHDMPAPETAEGVPEN